VTALFCARSEDNLEVIAVLKQAGARRL
jgi:hypothetical protein